MAEAETETNDGPTRGMNIHIYNYLKQHMFNKDKDTITYTYNMSFICSVWLICFNTSSYDICIMTMAIFPFDHGKTLSRHTMIPFIHGR